MDNSEIESIVDEVIDEYEQPDQFEKRFISFYRNTVKNNLGSKDLKRLIKNVDLPEEEEIDES